MPFEISNRGLYAAVLAAITALKKLCNHPKLIYDMITGAKNNDKGNSAAGFESCDQYFTPGMYDVRGGRGGGGMCDGGGGGWLAG